MLLSSLTLTEIRTLDADGALKAIREAEDEGFVKPENFESATRQSNVDALLAFVKPIKEAEKKSVEEAAAAKQKEEEEAKAAKLAEEQAAAEKQRLADEEKVRLQLASENMDPLQKLQALGFGSMQELQNMLKIFERTKKQTVYDREQLEIKAKELEDREVKLIAREKSAEKKAAELGEIAKKNSILWDRISAANKA